MQGVAMKIVIDYNGSCAICKVNGKNFQESDSLTKSIVLTSFRTIEQQYKRDRNNLLKT